MGEVPQRLSKWVWMPTPFAIVSYLLIIYDYTRSGLIPTGLPQGHLLSLILATGPFTYGLLIVYVSILRKIGLEISNGIPIDMTLKHYWLAHRVGMEELELLQIDLMKTIQVKLACRNKQTQQMLRHAAEHGVNMVMESSIALFEHTYKQLKGKVDKASLCTIGTLKMALITGIAEGHVKLVQGWQGAYIECPKLVFDAQVGRIRVIALKPKKIWRMYVKALREWREWDQETLVMSNNKKHRIQHIWGVIGMTRWAIVRLCEHYFTNQKVKFKIEDIDKWKENVLSDMKTFGYTT